MEGNGNGKDCLLATGLFWASKAVYDMSHSPVIDVSQKGVKTATIVCTTMIA